jgi:hypothetical protein
MGLLAGSLMNNGVMTRFVEQELRPKTMTLLLLWEE